MFPITLTKTLLVSEFQAATNLVASTHCSFKSHWETYRRERQSYAHTCSFGESITSPMIPKVFFRPFTTSWSKKTSPTRAFGLLEGSRTVWDSSFFKHGFSLGSVASKALSGAVSAIDSRLSVWSAKAECNFSSLALLEFFLFTNFRNCLSFLSTLSSSFFFWSSNSLWSSLNISMISFFMSPNFVLAAATSLSSCSIWREKQEEHN